MNGCAAGPGDDEAAASPPVRVALCENVVERLGPRLRLHHHAGAPAVRGVVDGAVAVVGEVAQVVDADVEQAVLARLADERQVERGEVVGEDRDDVDAHAAGPRRP